MVNPVAARNALKPGNTKMNAEAERARALYQDLLASPNTTWLPSGQGGTLAVTEGREIVRIVVTAQCVAVSGAELAGRPWCVACSAHA